MGFGDLAGLTSLGVLQEAVRGLTQADSAVLGHAELPLYDPAMGKLLGQLSGFVTVLGTLTPVVADLRGSAAFLVLRQLGLNIS